MERIRMRQQIFSLTTFGGVAVIAALLSAQAGTRFIPSPPPSHTADSESYPESSFGSTNPDVAKKDSRSQFDRTRFSSLEDEEGREIDFSTERANRRPAGMEVQGKTSTVKNLQKPSLQRMAVKGADDSLHAKQEDTRSQYVADLNDPLVRRKGVQEVAVIASDLGFFPKTFFVSKDVPVRIFLTGASKNSLCMMMDSFNVRKQVKNNKIEEITFVPSQPGTYRFYCPVNGSEGAMVVKELSSNDST